MAKPKKYVVIASSVGGLNNKVYQENDVVNESNFPEGHTESLVKQGFLKPADDKLTKAEAEKEAAEEKERLETEELAKLEEEERLEKEAAEKAKQAEASKSKK